MVCLSDILGKVYGKHLVAQPTTCMLAVSVKLSTALDGPQSDFSCVYDQCQTPVACTNGSEASSLVTIPPVNNDFIWETPSMTTIAVVGIAVVEYLLRENANAHWT